MTKRGDPSAGSRAATRSRALELGLWLLPVAGFFAVPDYLMLGSQLFVTCLFVVSLDLILGYAGVVSLGHAAFFGAGAYCAGLLSLHGWGEPISGLLASGLVAGLLGFATSFLVVSGESLTRLMVTLGIGMMLHEAANRATWLTGGTDGLSGMQTDPLFGVWHFDLFGRAAYLYAFGVLALCFGLLRRVASSPFGLSLRGIRENERRMPAIGASLRRHLVVAYALSAGLAGVAGAVSAQTTEFVGLEVLSFERSAMALIMLVLGGAGKLYGALVGASLYTLARELFSSTSPAYWHFWLGLLVMCSALLARGGVVGGVQAGLVRLRARRLRAARRLEEPS